MHGRREDSARSGTGPSQVECAVMNMVSTPILPNSVLENGERFRLTPQININLDMLLRKCRMGRGELSCCFDCLVSLHLWSKVEGSACGDGGH